MPYVVSKYHFFMKKNRLFENKKSEEKILATSLWKGGASIQKIAHEIKRSRGTVYRWLRRVDEDLSKPKKRKRISFDRDTKNKILEIYILMKKPKIPQLQSVLNKLFHIQLTQPQLRRWIRKWNLDDYRPSVFFDILIQERALTLKKDPSMRDRGGAFAGGSFGKSTESFSHPGVADLPSVEKDFHA